MCQSVAVVRVLAALIQPMGGGVGPFNARPGSRTWSHDPPVLSIDWPSSGSTVRAPVMGRLAGTCATTLASGAGPSRTVAAASSATVSWWAATCGVTAAAAGAAWMQAGATSRQPTTVRASLIL